MVKIQVQKGFITNSSSTVYTIVVFDVSLEDFFKWVDELLAKTDEELEENVYKIEYNDDIREVLESAKEHIEDYTSSGNTRKGTKYISFGGGGYDPETEFWNSLNVLEAYIKTKDLDHIYECHES